MGKAKHRTGDCRAKHLSFTCQFTKYILIYCIIIAAGYYGNIAHCNILLLFFVKSQLSCVFFSDVGCYLFPGTYARLTFRLRAHNFSLRGSLGVARLPTQPTRMRFYAIFDWICLRDHSLSNIFVWLRILVPRLQSCSGRGPWDYSLVVTW